MIKLHGLSFRSLSQSFLFVFSPQQWYPPHGHFPIVYKLCRIFCFIPSTQTVKQWGAWINPFDSRRRVFFARTPGRVQMNSSRDMKLRKKPNKKWDWKISQQQKISHDQQKELKKKTISKFNCFIQRNWNLIYHLRHLISFVVFKIARRVQVAGDWIVNATKYSPLFSWQETVDGLHTRRRVPSHLRIRHSILTMCSLSRGNPSHWYRSTIQCDECVQRYLYNTH